MAEPIPIRQQIINALDARLKTITVANGYLTNIGSNVEAWEVAPAEQSELPRVEYRDEDVESSQGDGVPEGLHAHRLKITVEVINKGDTALTEIRKQESDLHKSIGVEAGATGLRWGGVATFTEPGRSRIIVDQSEIKAGTLVFEFFINYRTLAWDSCTAA